MRMMPWVCLLAGSLALTALPPALDAQGDEHSHMRLLGHHDLGGRAGGGKGGEGIAMVQTASGRRILYVAEESGPMCFSVVDVTDPRSPQLVKQVEAPPHVRCNSLDLSGHLLTVAHEVEHAGLKPAGLQVWDVSSPADPRPVGFFDTSGPDSRGIHHVWFVDGRFAYVSTGAADFIPTNPKDDEFFMIVDLADPAHAREVSRWWYPGTRVGDPVPPPPRNPRFDSGYRLHNVDVYPDHPTRAYLGYIDGGIVILDISDKTRPRPVFIGRYDPPATVGFTHTAMPLFSRHLLVVSAESVYDRCLDAPKRIWVWDLHDERRPRPLAPAPYPANAADLCRRGGRFGAHNIWENRPGPWAFHSDRLVLGSFFAGGVRVYDIADPARPREVAYDVPAAPPGSPAGSIQINHVYWDDRGIIYAVDRLGGGLYTFQLTASP